MIPSFVFNITKYRINISGLGMPNRAPATTVLLVTKKHKIWRLKMNYKGKTKLQKKRHSRLKANNWKYIDDSRKCLSYNVLFYYYFVWCLNQTCWVEKIRPVLENRSWIIFLPVSSRLQKYDCHGGNCTNNVFNLLVLNRQLNVFLVAYLFVYSVNIGYG